MNDDMHRYGALRESYAFEYSVLEQADKNKNTHFDFDTYDTYQWYLNLGPVTNINAKYLHGIIPFWNDTVAHPDYDEFWKKEAWVNQLHCIHGAEPERGRLLGSGRPLGTVADFPSCRTNTTPTTPTSWWPDPGSTASGRLRRAIASASFLLAATRPRANFAKNIEAPFFRYYLHGKGAKPHWKATTFQTRIEYLAHLCDLASRRKRSPRICICTPMGRSLSFAPSRSGGPAVSRSMCPIRPILCPIGSARFRRPIPAGIGGPGKLPISAL